jgi:hypothetical protein
VIEKSSFTLKRNVATTVKEARTYGVEISEEIVERSKVLVSVPMRNDVIA